MGRNDDRSEFGEHVRSLREARGLTREQVAKRAELSTNTIRRLEQGSFSPSRDTLEKLSRGLKLKLSTLFDSYEVCQCLTGTDPARCPFDHSRELLDSVRALRPEERSAVLRVLELTVEVLRVSGSTE